MERLRIRILSTSNVPASSGGLFEGTNAWTVSGSTISPSYSFEASEEDSFETCGVHVPASYESIGGVKFSNDNTVLPIAMHPLISITDLTGLPPLLYVFQSDFAEALIGSSNTNVSLGPALVPMTTTVPTTHLCTNASLSDSNCTTFSNIIGYKPVSLDVQWSLNIQGLPDSGAVKPQVVFFVRRSAHTQVNVDLLPHDRGPPLIDVDSVYHHQEPTDESLKVGCSLPLSKIELPKSSLPAPTVKIAVLPSSANSPSTADASVLIATFDLLRSTDATSSPTLSLLSNDMNVAKFSAVECSLRPSPTCVDVNLLPHDRGPCLMSNCPHGRM